MPGMILGMILGGVYLRDAGSLGAWKVSATIWNCVNWLGASGQLDLRHRRDVLCPEDLLQGVPLHGARLEPLQDPPDCRQTVQLLSVNYSCFLFRGHRDPLHSFEPVVAGSWIDRVGTAG